jgi:hypothetical protein
MHKEETVNKSHECPDTLPVLLDERTGEEAVGGEPLAGSGFEDEAPEPDFEEEQ